MSDDRAALERFEPYDEERIDPATGLRMVIARHSTDGHWVGYVELAEDHPWRTQAKPNPRVPTILSAAHLPQLEDVHGGRPDWIGPHRLGRWLVGFHCAHWGDYKPRLPAEQQDIENPRVWTPEEVWAECAKLARHVAAAGQ